MQVSDSLYLGPAIGPQPSMQGLAPSPMSQGVGPVGRVLVYDLVPLTLQASGLAAAQAVAGAANLALTAGTGVTRETGFDGAFLYVLDVPRCVTVVSANAGDTTQTATVSGFDALGAPATARVTLSGTTPAVTLKAFRKVKSIAINGATAGNINAGFNDRLGLPVAVSDAGYIDPSWAGVLARDAGTFVAAVTTDPSTVLLGDVRGLYTPSSAANGARRLVLKVYLSEAQAGPSATRNAAFGVAQV